MVVTYDRFVFFSVEKFFIPLLYSCLYILVPSKREREREKEKMSVNVYGKKWVPPGVNDYWEGGGMNNWLYNKQKKNIKLERTGSMLMRYPYLRK